MENLEVQKKFNILEFYKKYSLFINMGILSIFFLANCFFMWVSYIVLPIAFLMMIFSSTKNALSYIIFIFPFCWFELAFGMIMIAICLVSWVIKTVILKHFKEGIKFNLSIKTIVLLCACLAFSFIPVSGIYNPHVFIKGLFVIVLFGFTYLMIKLPEEFRLKYNLCILAVALLIASLFSLFAPVSALLQDILEVHYAAENIVRFSALFYNPNNLGLVCEIGMIILAYYFVANKSTKRDIFTFALFTVLGILTFSKAFAIICGILMIILLCCAIKNKRKRVWITLGVAAVAIMLIFIIRPDFLMVYLNRATVPSGSADIVGSITTGRSNLWSSYTKYLIDNPLYLFFGRGFGAPRIEVFSPHNLYLSIIYQLGIIGTALMVATMVFVILDAKKHNENKIGKSILMPLILIGMLSLVEDFIFYIA